jgi:hypothetical protein
LCKAGKLKSAITQKLEPPEANSSCGALRMNIEEAGHANALETLASRFQSRRFESGHAHCAGANELCSGAFL